MNGIAGHEFAMQGYIGTFWANEMNLGVNDAPGAGSIELLTCNSALYTNPHFQLTIAKPTTTNELE